MKHLLILIFIPLLLTSCKPQQNSKNTSSKDNDKVIYEDLEILKKQRDFELRAGACMGTCPVFEFHYIKDSLAILTAKENILSPGTYYYLLDNDQINELNQLINLDWEKFDDVYITNLQDLPTNMIYIRLKNSEKEIKIEGLEPKTLLNLKEALLERIKSYKWEKLAPK